MTYVKDPLTKLLRRVKCQIRVDDMLWYRNSPEELLAAFDEILICLERFGLFAAAHKCQFFPPELSCCGKGFFPGQVSHDPDRVQGLVMMHRL